MAMRRKTTTTYRVRKPWRCKECGAKVETVACYACEIKQLKKAKRERTIKDINATQRR